MPSGMAVKLIQSLKTGSTLSTIGNLMYFTGFGVGLISILSSSDSHGPNGLTITCSAIQLAGPILSCIGGDISSKAMNRNYWQYGNHNGWHDYSAAWGLAVTDILLAFIGSGIANSSQSDAIGWATVGAVAVIGITADIYMIKSVVGPLKYSNRAMHEVE